MKNTTINKIVGIILLAGVCEIGLVGVPAMINLTRARASMTSISGPTDIM